MNCCEDCFLDTELKGFIYSNSTVSGDCDYCGKIGTNLINPREFEEKFSLLVNIYDNIEQSDRRDLNPNSLHVKIQSEWNVFSDRLDVTQQKKLLSDIFSNSSAEVESLLEGSVERKIKIKDLDQSDFLEKEWDSFVDEIKHHNRFFLGKKIDLKLLRNLFEFHTKIYKKGKLFYRARISDEEGIILEKMGKPPSDKSTSGRANPTGIPYLYVATNKETVINECRATHSDYVAVAEFKLIDDLKVVSLRQIENISPFSLEEEIEEYLKNQRYLKRLENELSRPLRRNDNKLDYLPTQYICEYAKYLEFDAVEYGSSLNKEGINLAIFKDSKLRPLSIELNEILAVKNEVRVVK